MILFFFVHSRRRSRSASSVSRRSRSISVSYSKDKRRDQIQGSLTRDHHTQTCSLANQNFNHIGFSSALLFLLLLFVELFVVIGIYYLLYVVYFICFWSPFCVSCFCCLSIFNTTIIKFNGHRGTSRSDLVLNYSFFCLLLAL